MFGAPSRGDTLVPAPVDALQPSFATGGTNSSALKLSAHAATNVINSITDHSDCNKSSIRPPRRMTPCSLRSRPSRTNGAAAVRPAQTSAARDGFVAGGRDGGTVAFDRTEERHREWMIEGTFSAP